MDKSSLKFQSLHFRELKFGTTVELKLDQGSPGNGGNYCRVSFLPAGRQVWLLFGQAKSDKQFITELEAIEY